MFPMALVANSGWFSQDPIITFDEWVAMLGFALVFGFPIAPLAFAAILLAVVNALSGWPTRHFHPWASFCLRLVCFSPIWLLLGFAPLAGGWLILLGLFFLSLGRLLIELAEVSKRGF